MLGHIGEQKFLKAVEVIKSSSGALRGSNRKVGEIVSLALINWLREGIIYKIYFESILQPVLILPIFPPPTLPISPLTHSLNFLKFLTPQN